MSFLSELRRRKVFRVATVYLAVAWLVLQVSATLVQSLNLAAWVNHGVVLLLLIGLPITLMAAWAYEIKPEDELQANDKNNRGSRSKSTGRNIDYVVIPLLVIAIGYFVIDNFFLDSNPGAEAVGLTAEKVDEVEIDQVSKSIAVLPFADLSPNGDQEYFAHGISEELLNVLAALPDLKVSARTSSFIFGDNPEDVRSIADALGVDNLLEGSVRKSGNQLRITAQLIDAQSGFHIWSDVFDQEVTDIFLIQDQIALEIMEALKVELALNNVPESVRSTSTDAYLAFLEARYLLERRGEENIANAIEALERSIELDPDYAPSYAVLAEAIVDQRFWGNLTEEQVIARATPLVERALELDPNAAEAHYSKSLLISLDQQTEPELFRRKMLERLVSIDKALELNPNMASGWVRRARSLTLLGRREDAFASSRSAYNLDPMSYGPVMNWALELGIRGRYDESHQVVDRLLRVRKDAGSYRLQAVVHLLEGRPDVGFSAITQALSMTPGDRGLEQILRNIYIHLAAADQARSLISGPQDEVALLRALGQWGGAAALSAQNVLDNPGKGNFLRDAAIAHIEAGDAVASVGYFSQLAAVTENQVGPLFGGGPNPSAVELTRARMMTNDNQGAAELLTELRAYSDSAKSDGMAGAWWRLLEAEVLALEGRDEEALLEFGSLVDSGIVTGVIRTAAFQHLFGDPRYENIIDRHDREKTRQREVVLSQL